MKTTIIGAAGRTGRQLVRLAHEHGHDVVAVARRPEAMLNRGAVWIVSVPA